MWRPAPLAHLADVLRVHEYEYVRKLEVLCTSLARQLDSSPHQPAIGQVDCDTEVSPHSFAAAMRGAGSVVEAVRSVCATPREARNCFCAVRPPGHHAGPRGAVGGQSAGFCLLSNATIGAAFALSTQRTLVQRVALIDFDVHHGNGSEACFKNLRPTEHKEVFQTSLGSLSLSRVDYKPWLASDDHQRVFFGSIHGFGVETPFADGGDDATDGDANGHFYPGSGGPGTDVDAPRIQNSPMQLRADSTRWRRAMMSKLLVPLSQFRPDLIIVSAGFDAHAHDPLEAGGLHEVDFEWMSRELLCIAETCCDGRLVSVLEGGYRINGGPLASLGRAVAAHVGVLSQPYLAKVRWDPTEAALRLEQTVEAESRWSEQRAQALEAANAAAVQPDGAPARRTKRRRAQVDYEELQAQIEAEEQAASEEQAVSEEQAASPSSAEVKPETTQGACT